MIFENYTSRFKVVSFYHEDCTTVKKSLCKSLCLEITADVSKITKTVQRDLSFIFTNFKKIFTVLSENISNI